MPLGKIPRIMLKLSNLARLALVLALPAVCAQDYPGKPIRMVVPYSAGGVSDNLARAVSEKLASAIKQPVIVENRPGGNLVVGAEHLGKSPPDGYTLMIVAEAAVAMHGTLSERMPYTETSRFAPVIALANSPQGLFVANNVPAASVREFVALAREKNGTLAYATLGPGSTPHVNMQLFQEATRVNLTDVAYKGAAPAVTDLIGGHVSAMLVSVGLAAPHVKAGKLKAIAAGGAKRSTLLPGTPTFKESGLDHFTPNSWFAIVTVAGTPQDIVMRLNTELNTILKDPEFVAKLENTGGLEPLGGSPADLSEKVRAELAGRSRIPSIKIK